MQNIRSQYLATICVNLPVVAYGIAVGWCSPTIPALLSEESPLNTGPITKYESSWISSIFWIGTGFGALCSGPMIARLGRIRLLMTMGPAQIAGWLLISFAQNVYYLYCARFIMGFLGSVLFVVIPVYVTEIAHDSVRGSLGSITILSANIGVFLASLVAAIIHFTIVPFIGLAVSVTCFGWLFFIPETPQYLTATKRYDDAEKSSGFYHGGVAVSNEDKVEMEADQSKNNRITFDDFRGSATRKAIMISIVLVPLSQLSGVLVILNYMSQIFAEAGISINSNHAACIVTALQILGSYISTILVERLGRKILIAASAFGSGMFFVMMGAHDFLKTGMQMNVSAYGWVPLLSLSGVLFISATGLISLPYVVSAEVLPQKIRAVVIGSCTVLRSLILFAYFQYFNWLISTFNVYGTMWLFALFCWICTAFMLVVVPETKGKSFEEIRKSLRSKN